MTVSISSRFTACLSSSIFPLPRYVGEGLFIDCVNRMTGFAPAARASSDSSASESSSCHISSVLRMFTPTKIARSRYGPVEYVRFFGI